MTVEEIINSIQELTETDIIKFDEEFAKIIKPYHDKAKKESASKKKKEQYEKKKKVIEIGDKICDMIGLSAFPYAEANQWTDAPYELWTHYGNDCWKYFDDIIESNGIDIDELNWSTIEELMNQFVGLLPDSYFCEEDDGQGYFYHHFFKIYNKGGEFSTSDSESYEDFDLLKKR